MEIDIPFREDMKEAVLSGRKKMTSRYKRYGNVGDVFFLNNKLFVLTSVFKEKLSMVAYVYYKEEGVETPGEFIVLWEELHPRRGYCPDDVVWVHVFERDDETCK